MSKYYTPSWKEVEELLSSGRKVVALIPTGSVEQHGPHLPIDTDLRIAYSLTRKVFEEFREELEKYGISLIYLPPVPYGVSEMWLGNVGTVSVDSTTYLNYVSQVIRGVLQWGVKYVVIINGHAGNSEALKLAARESLKEVEGGKVAVISWWELVGDVINDLFQTKFFHADEVETSVAVALGIELLAEPLPSPPPHRRYSEEWHSLDLTKRPRVYVFESESRVKRDPGSFGRPDLYSIDKGRRLVEVFLSRLVSFLREFASD